MSRRPWIGGRRAGFRLAAATPFILGATFIWSVLTDCGPAVAVIVPSGSASALPTAPSPDVVGISRSSDNGGYVTVTATGVISTYGDATGTDVAVAGTAPVVGIVAVGNAMAGGIWTVGEDGGVFTLGGVEFYGSMGGTKLNAPIVGMASTLTGDGYWLVSADGGVFGFGDARFSGSMGGTRINAPIVGMAASAQGGYWLVGADGGVYSFGGAPFLGSMGSKVLDAPAAGMAATTDGGGYWLVSRSGGVFTFGDANFFGSSMARPNATG